MGKKSTATPGKSSASAATASSSTASQKSSVLKSAFAPSRYQLRLFASVIQSFESQQLRIHDTTTSRLQCQHAAQPGERINCLAWGRYRHSDSSSQTSSSSKKRKKGQEKQDVVIAYGTSLSEICMLSPTEGKVVGKLAGGHERGVTTCAFSEDDTSVWSIGGDNKLIRWDIKTGSPIRSIALSESSIACMNLPSQPEQVLLCASSTPYSITLADEDDFRIQPFDSMKHAINTLERSGSQSGSDQEYFLAADDDRYIHIYDISQKRLVRTLIVGAGVDSADLETYAAQDDRVWDQQMLAVLTKDGVVEFFPHPFVLPAIRNGDLKSNRKSLTQKCTAGVKLINTDSKNSSAQIMSASLQGPELVVASVDGGANISFQKIRWQDEGTGEMLFEGMKEVARVKSASAFKAANPNGVKDLSSTQVDDSKVVVTNGVVEVIDSDSEDDGSGLDEASEVEDQTSESEGENEVEDTSANDEVSGSDEEMEDAEPTAIQMDAAQKSGLEEASEPSFGEMLAAKQVGEVVIADAFESDAAALSLLNSGGGLSIPPGMSLGTVLTQALRTNDRSLLEACLHTIDTDVVRNTIQRLDSSLAGILFTKLAERMARRPGRYGHLQNWVQQLCVAHGAALATQPRSQKHLKNLFNVLDQRAKSLPHLLLLKGKLDMLDAQLRFRRQLAAQRAANVTTAEGQPDMIYIEGEGDNWDSDDDLDEAADAVPSKRLKSNAVLRRDLSDLMEGEGTDDEEMPVPNGVLGSDSEEDDDESDVQQQSGGLVDEEAEEEEDSDEEGSDVSSNEEDDEEEEEEDSEMDDFIDDAEIDEDEAVSIDDKDDTPKKPPTKKSKHNHR